MGLRLQGQLIDELLVMLQLARCIFGVAIKHLAPLSMDEDLPTCGTRRHGWLPLGLLAFLASLKGGILAFEHGRVGLNTLVGLGTCTLNLGVRG